MYNASDMDTKTDDEEMETAVSMLPEQHPLQE
jgi:hypothetical protein